MLLFLLVFFLLSSLFDSCSLKAWACQRAPYTAMHVSLDAHACPHLLFELFESIVRISLLSIVDLHEAFFLCVSGCWHIHILSGTFWSHFFKSVWNVCLEMSSTLFLSFVNSKMTWSLFPVSVTPTLPPSPPLLVRIKSWEPLHVFLLHDILLEGLEFQLTVLSRSNLYERNLYELLKFQIFTHSLDFYHISCFFSFSHPSP